MCTQRTETLFKLLKLGLSGITITTDATGAAHIQGIGSPEYPGPVGQTDTNFGLSIVRWGARALVSLGEAFPSTLGTDPAVAHYREILGQLVPFSHDSTGYMLDPTHRFLLPHRHWSHIIMIYDLELAEGRFNHSAGADNSLLTTSLDHWSGLTCNDTLTCPNSCRGFSRGATAVMSALMNRPEAARGNLTRLLDQVLAPNGMYGEGVTSNAYGSERYQISPCPESAYIGSAALHEQLVHSDVATASDGKRCATVRVFPASVSVADFLPEFEILAFGLVEVEFGIKNLEFGI